MFENLNRWEKGAVAEERAFEKYGGIKHPNLYGTIPDLQRAHKGEYEFIEVKYINLVNSYLRDRILTVKLQLTKREKFLPKGATQRLYILFDNFDESGWETEELVDTVMRGLEGLDVTVDMEVVREAE